MWRLVTSDHFGHPSPAQILDTWTLQQVLDAHEIQDLLDDMAAEAAKAK